ENLLTLAGAPADKQLAALADKPAAEPFVEEFRTYLDVFGWRSGLFEFSAPTLFEDPSVPLDQVRAFMAMPDYVFAAGPGTAEQGKQTEERERYVAETRAALEPDQRQRLQAAIDAAVDVVPILEDHNYYIDQRVGVLPRRLVLAAGRRLTSAVLLPTQRTSST